MQWTDRLRRWLGRKASATSRAVVLLTVPGEPVTTPRNYERLAKEGYEANVTVYACINEIGKAMGGLRWLEFDRRRGRDREVEDSRMRALLARPNPLQGYSRFAQSWTGYLMISGNAYIERVGPGAGAAALMQPPRELWTLRPDRMEVIPDAAAGVSAYRYRAGGVEVRLPAPLVHHMTLFAPTNDWYGLSPIQVAATVVDTDNAAQRWNFSLIKNGMRPSGALVVAKNLSEPQFDRLKAQMTEEYAGAERAGLPLLLEGGMTWEEMGINPKDLDWINSRRMSKQDIATLYGTPAELIGLKEATYENRREAKRAFYTETVLPLADAFRDELNAWLVPLFDDSGRRRLEYDRDAIEALQEDREKVWSRVGDAAWLTINEKRVATGYDEVADGDVLLVPFNLLPLGALGEETGPAFGELPADESAEQRGLRTERKADALSPQHSVLSPDPARDRLWKGFVRQTLSLEREYARAVARWYRQQQDLVLRRLEAYLAAQPAGSLSLRGAEPVSLRGAAEAISSEVAASPTPRNDMASARKAAEDLLFELDEEAGRLRDVSRAYFTRAQQRGGEGVWVELRAAGAFGADARTAAERLRVQLERGRFAAMAATARQRVARAIDAGLNAPDGAESVGQIASRIRDVYRGLSGPQAQTIARTETARAYNEGRDEAMEQLGVEETEWLSARDEAVREAPYDHTIDGETRRRGEPFSNGLRYPHDPSGAAGNLINCRCVALPVVRA
jgi:HK97 family phage portal protein